MKKIKTERYGKDYYVNGGNSNYSFYKDKPYNKIIIDYITQNKKGGELLEVGCAYGYVLKYASKNFKTTGIDLSKFAISKAKKITPKSNLYVGDIEKDLEKIIKKKKFDVIIALDILEHLNNPERVIKLISRSLNKNGIFIFRVPNLSGLDKKFYYLVGKPEMWHGNKDKTHISLYSVKKWKQLVNKGGFKIRLLPYIPTRILKEYTSRNAKRFFFIPSFLGFTNMSITFYCIKDG